MQRHEWVDALSGHSYGSSREAFSVYDAEELHPNLSQKADPHLSLTGMEAHDDPKGGVLIMGVSKQAFFHSRKLTPIAL